LETGSIGGIKIRWIQENGVEQQRGLSTAFAQQKMACPPGVKSEKI